MARRLRGPDFASLAISKKPFPCRRERERQALRPRFVADGVQQLLRRTAESDAAPVAARSRLPRRLHLHAPPRQSQGDAGGRWRSDPNIEPMRAQSIVVDSVLP